MTNTATESLHKGTMPVNGKCVSSFFQRCWSRERERERERKSETDRETEKEKWFSFFYSFKCRVTTQKLRLQYGHAQVMCIVDWLRQ